MLLIVCANLACTKAFAKKVCWIICTAHVLQCQIASAHIVLEEEPIEAYVSQLVCYPRLLGLCNCICRVGPYIDCMTLAVRC